LIAAIVVVRTRLAVDGPVRIIAFTSLEDDATFHEALRAGVTRFLLKTSSRGEVLHAIRRVHRGGAMLSPKLITRALED
jgi:two component transcriptional regulator, luxR family